MQTSYGRIGGCGIRDLELFNKALLTKIGWKLITQPNSFSSSILKAKYFHFSTFLEAHVKVGTYLRFGLESFEVEIYYSNDLAGESKMANISVEWKLDSV